MAVTTDIVASYRHPRAVVRRRIDQADEGRALALLMGACVLVFVSQWPGHARAAHLDPLIPLDARLGGALMATLFFLPPIAYGVAFLGRLVARLFGGRGTGLGARVALFWSLVAISPLMLLQGLVAGLIGPGPALSLTGAGVGLAFAYLWLNAMVEAERA